MYYIDNDGTYYEVPSNFINKNIGGYYLFGSNKNIFEKIGVVEHEE